MFYLLSMTVVGSPSNSQCHTLVLAVESGGVGSNCLKKYTNIVDRLIFDYNTCPRRSHK